MLAAERPSKSVRYVSIPVDHPTYASVVKQLRGPICIGDFDFEQPFALIFGPNGVCNPGVELHVLTQVESATYAIQVLPYFWALRIQLWPVWLEILQHSNIKFALPCYDVTYV